MTAKLARIAYAEPFDLFGVPIADYDAVFYEKLDLLLALRGDAPLTWSGRFRPALNDQPVATNALRQTITTAACLPVIFPTMRLNIPNIGFCKSAT